MGTSAEAITAEQAWVLADNVGHAHALFSNQLEEIVRLDGLTMKEAIALWIAQQSDEGMSQTEWGKLQGVSRQRAHVIAKSLEQNGLVHIVRSGRDSQVMVTAAGRKLVAKSRTKVGQTLEKALGGMTQRDAVELTELLNNLILLLSAE